VRQNILPFSRKKNWQARGGAGGRRRDTVVLRKKRYYSIGPNIRQRPLKLRTEGTRLPAAGTALAHAVAAAFATAFGVSRNFLE
jgi:hypothetical protein